MYEIIKTHIYFLLSSFFLVAILQDMNILIYQRPKVRLRVQYMKPLILM